MIDLSEPVFQQDIDTEHEYATQGWKVMYEFHERLKAQGAPQELVAQVAALTQQYQTLTNGIASIQRCFPVEKRR